MDVPLLDSAAVAQLLEQHDELRLIADECETLADRLEDGDDVAAELTSRLGWLRLAFDTHNRYEERLLRQLMIAQLGPARVVDRLVSAHVDDHRALRTSLDEAQASAVRGVLALVRRHLADEEQYFVAHAPAEAAR